MTSRRPEVRGGTRTKQKEATGGEEGSARPEQFTQEEGHTDKAAGDRAGDWRKTSTCVNVNVKANVNVNGNANGNANDWRRTSTCATNVNVKANANVNGNVNVNVSVTALSASVHM